MENCKWKWLRRKSGLVHFISNIYIYIWRLPCNSNAITKRESKAVCGVVDILVGSSCYLLFSRTSKGLLNLLDRPFIACRGKLFALLAAKRPKKGAEPEQPSYIKKDHSLHHHWFLLLLLHTYIYSKSSLNMISGSEN